MSASRTFTRLQGAYARRIARWFGRRPFLLQPRRPLVTFTFDDFPRSALYTGGSILETHGARGTYYVALRLAGRTIETGTMFETADLNVLLSRGHELGCHTYEHLPAWETQPATYLASVEQNMRELGALAKNTRPATHSYPISYPRPSSKRSLAAHFRACRFCGQDFNYGRVDLNALQSFFIEQSANDFSTIERRIADNASARGWLIFSTHDVTARPTRYGCTEDILERIVCRTRESGAAIVTMSAALDELGVPNV